MTTALATITAAQLPAHLQNNAQLLALNDSALGGIKSGGFPSIGIKGAKFFIKDPGAEEPEVLITMEVGGQRLPTPYLDTVILAANPNVSKKFYPGKYDPSAEDKTPECSSDNGITPDSHITAPKHHNCAECHQNKWGSKINEENGKEGKACSDFKRLVLTPSADLKFKALALDVTPSALKEYGAYVRTLTARNIPIVGVVTRITFDPAASFPKLQFNFLRFLDATEFAIVQERIVSDEVQAIVAPKRVVPIVPAAAPAPAVQPSISMPDPTTNNMAATVAAAAAATAANAPVSPVDIAAAQAAANVIAFPTGQPAVAQAGTVNFGGSPAADTTKKTRGKKVEPATPAPGVDAVTAAAAAVVTGVPVVDINTVPEPFKAAIIASGGLGSPGGDAIYAAMPKPAAAAVVSPTPPVTPAQPVTTFSVAPPSATVAGSPGDLNSQLTALLAKK